MNLPTQPQDQKCPTCGGSGYERLNGMVIACRACTGKVPQPQDPRDEAELTLEKLRKSLEFRVRDFGLSVQPNKDAFLDDVTALMEAAKLVDAQWPQLKRLLDVWFKHLDTYIASTLQQQREADDAAFAKIIGEDEKEEWGGEWYEGMAESNGIIRGANELRKEARAAWNKYSKESR